jgi:hypothetical protein
MDRAFWPVHCKTAKYEYLDGVLYMLAGGTNNYAIIAANII